MVKNIRRRQSLSLNTHFILYLNLFQLSIVLPKFCLNERSDLKKSTKTPCNKFTLDFFGVIWYNTKWKMFILFLTFALILRSEILISNRGDIYQREDKRVSVVA